MTPQLLGQGKVRDIYDLGDRLLLIATDRISAFDWVLPTRIPDKGRVLTQTSRFWFEMLNIDHHVLSYDVDPNECPEAWSPEDLEGRAMVVRKCEVVPIECVARGYLVGSGWKEYQRSQSVCGIPLPEGLEQAAQLPETLFTPATKAEEGHDENIPFEVMSLQVGDVVAEELKLKTLMLYERGREFAATKGIIIADTKFEWGWFEGQLILIDEVLTPDSSRFWPADQYRTGISPPSYDKQFVRDYLESTTWDKKSEPPELPEEIVQRTREKYIEAYERLTDNSFAWK